MTPNQVAIFSAVRAYILSLIDCEVVRGLDNGVPMPKQPFICLTPTMSNRLATNQHSYDGLSNKAIQANMDYSIQIDCYGPLSSDWAAIISATWRDDYAVNKMAPTCAPLYADDPKQLPIVDGEANFEQRWMLNAVLQYNPVVTVPQDFFDNASVEFINVTVEYPPEQ